MVKRNVFGIEVRKSKYAETPLGRSAVSWQYAVSCVYAVTKAVAPICSNYAVTPIGRFAPTRRYADRCVYSALERTRYIAVSVCRCACGDVQRIPIPNAMVKR